jgi:hypothetical protein
MGATKVADCILGGVEFCVFCSFDFYIPRPKDGKEVTIVLHILLDTPFSRSSQRRWDFKIRNEDAQGRTFTLPYFVLCSRNVVVMCAVTLRVGMLEHHHSGKSRYACIFLLLFVPKSHTYPELRQSAYK